MTEYSRLNIIYKLQKWMDSVPGQTFMNYAYSWGASIVILGTLFKLTHLPGANFFVCLGMGTEVLVFFLSAFDRPFDKTADGMELQTHVDSAVVTSADRISASAPVGGPVGVPVGASVGVPVSGPTVIGGTGSGTIVINGTPGGEPAHEAPQWTAPQLPEGMEKTIAGYADELENLNRTLTGISRVYEMQLKSASTQIGTIDEINEQTRRMARQIAELNQIYARMIEAMQVRMTATP